MTLRIALRQMNPLVGDIAGNTETVITSIRRAQEQFAAHAIVFPELAVCGYPPEDLLLRADFLRQCHHALLQIADHACGIDVIVGFPEAATDGLFNSAAVLRDGRVLTIYRKHALPNYGVFDEKRYFSPGIAPGLFDLQGATVGVTICEDLWQPGMVERSAQAGAQLMINLNASPFHVNKVVEREAVARERLAVAQTPLIYLNQVGGQDELVFDGASFVMDAHGIVTQRLPEFRDTLAVVELSHDLHGVIPVPNETAALLDANPSIYEAIVLAIRDYVGKNGFRGAVLGLSGGIDSAVTLALAADALGGEQIEAVLMPSRYTAQMSVDDAVTQARRLGVAYHVISIEPAFNAFLEMLRAPFSGLPADITEENLQARCRGVVLMAMSNKTGKILLTTGNKSEMSVGYATLYGDMAGGFAPLKDVYKQQVYQLAHYRNGIAPVIPERVITRPPSAELAPGQIDEDSLPPYALLDAILQMYVEEDRAVEEIVAAGFPAEHVLRTVSLVDRNEYKRRQAPPGVRISRRAFGRERRYPITSGFGRRWRA